MQINPSENPVNTNLAKLLQETQQRKVTQSDAVVNELGNELDLIIQKAMKNYQSDDSRAVQEAKQAIADGTLDTPETIQMAAEKLLTFGI
jgi:anti-sigma28 factor (negative regulator of flagellin synthesis)